MRRASILALLLSVLASAALSQPPAAASDSAHMRIYTRRGAFDPLQRPVAHLSSARAAPASDLALVQLALAPGPAARQELEAAGLRPLWYFPEHTYLVRKTGDADAKRVRQLRWMGEFDISYKIAPELDPLLAGGDVRALDLLVAVAPDADPAGVTAFLEAGGGTLLDRSDTTLGALLRVRTSTVVLKMLIVRDDVLWAEVYRAPEAADDRSGLLLGVPLARDDLGLTGAGQTIALTDTGLDVEGELSDDFGLRMARGFSRQEMYAGCSSLAPAKEPGSWSDLHGHGTHVAGSALGNGALSGGQYTGVAPEAAIVVQATSSGGTTLDCLPGADAYMQLAYDAGARIQNASFGRPTGTGSCKYGCYTGEDAATDDFLWRHPDHLFVTVAGNSAADSLAPFGVVDGDAINSPATSKNALVVGASENDRPGAGCGGPSPEQTCWAVYGFGATPLSGDLISDSGTGMAAFSSRGPTDDGRIKPDIVAPGTNVIAARSHHAAASYAHPVGDYAYYSGTSMAAPQVSALAALVRQWLVQQRGVTTPSASLVKAMLLNGAVDLAPGQYAGSAEIPSTWPNTVQGWGRASIEETLGRGSDDSLLLVEHSGLTTGGEAEYSVSVAAGRPLRVTLAWTDYPAAPASARSLVNDLDLEVIAPGGVPYLGNASAELADACRSGGADRCNNVESVQLGVPYSGIYTVRVRGALVPEGPQPFALVVGGERVTDSSLAAPALHYVGVSGPAVTMSWEPVPGAAYYRAQLSRSSTFTSGVQSAATEGVALTVIADVGGYYVRVRACTVSGCGEYSGAQLLSVTAPAEQVLLPMLGR